MKIFKVLTLLFLFSVSLPTFGAQETIVLDCTKIWTQTGDKETETLYIDRFDDSSVMYVHQSDFVNGLNGLMSKASLKNKMIFVAQDSFESVTYDFTNLVNDPDLALIKAWKIKTVLRASDVESALVAVGVCYQK